MNSCDSIWTVTSTLVRAWRKYSQFSKACVPIRNCRSILLEVFVSVNLAHFGISLLTPWETVSLGLSLSLSQLKTLCLRASVLQGENAKPKTDEQNLLFAEQLRHQQDLQGKTGKSGASRSLLSHSSPSWFHPSLSTASFLTQINCYCRKHWWRQLTPVCKSPSLAWKGNKKLKALEGWSYMVSASKSLGQLLFGTSLFHQERASIWKEGRLYSSHIYTVSWWGCDTVGGRTKENCFLSSFLLLPSLSQTRRKPCDRSNRKASLPVFSGVRLGILFWKYPPK